MSAQFNIVIMDGMIDHGIPTVHLDTSVLSYTKYGPRQAKQYMLELRDVWDHSAKGNGAKVLLFKEALHDPQLREFRPILFIALPVIDVSRCAFVQIERLKETRSKITIVTMNPAPANEDEYISWCDRLSERLGCALDSMR